jgi:hypothetical protein
LTLLARLRKNPTLNSPYSSPLSGGEPTPPIPAYTLFDSGSVTLATLFGSAIGGTILMAVNYRRLGKGSNAAVALAIGLAVTGLAIVCGNLTSIPQGVSVGLAIGLVVAMRSSAQAIQGPIVQQHVRQGGKLGSRWAAFGIGVAGLVAIMAGIFLVVLVQQVVSTSNSQVTIGTKDVVGYSGSTTKEDAQVLGEKLKTIGYFSDKGVIVLLSKDKGDTVVSFVVKEGAWNQPEMITAFEEIGRQIAPSVGGFPIKVRLIDSQRETKKELTAGKAIIGTKDEIYYFGSATGADAKALGQELKTAGFLGDRGVTVLLSKGDGAVISFIVREGFWENPENVAGFEKLARQAASSVGGLPIKLRLLNSALETKKEVTVQ